MKFTKEHREKLSVARMGKVPWNKGIKGVIKQSPETIRKRIEAIKKRGVWPTQHEDVKRKISESNKGKEATKETKEKLSKAHMGYIMPQEQRKKIGESVKNSPKFQAVNWSALRKKSWIKNPAMGMTGRKLTNEHKRKIRAGILKYVQNGGKLKTMMGKNETVLLDLQEKKDGTKIKRQYIVNELGYVVDGYCPETNTIYEVYEHKHRHTRDMLKDIQREKEIREFLGCSFVVIWDE